MNLTPKLLREWADWDEENDPDSPHPTVFRAHAATLEDSLKLRALAERALEDLEEWVEHGKGCGCHTARTQAIIDDYRAAYPKDGA